MESNQKGLHRDDRAILKAGEGWSGGRDYRQHHWLRFIRGWVRNLQRHKGCGAMKPSKELVEKARRSFPLRQELDLAEFGALIASDCAEIAKPLDEALADVIRKRFGVRQ